MDKVSTHLMFQGQAADALDLYSSVFADFSVKHIKNYAEEDDGPTGMIKRADVMFAGHSLIVIDSPVSHEFDFTASVSLYVNIKDEAAIETIFDELAKEGNVMMPLDNYGISKKFGWLADRFGVSWQLNLPSE